MAAGAFAPDELEALRASDSQREANPRRGLSDSFAGESLQALSPSDDFREAVRLWLMATPLRGSALRACYALRNVLRAN